MVYMHVIMRYELKMFACIHSIVIEAVCFRVYHFNSIYSYQFISSLLAVYNYHHCIVFSAIRHPIICFKKEINNIN